MKHIHTFESFSNESVTEAQVLLFDEIGPELVAFRSKIEKLINKSTDDKWIIALKKTMSSLDRLENDLSKADSKLGVVLTEGLSSEQKMVETFLKKVAKEFDYSIEDAARFVKETISAMGIKESKVNEGAMSDIDLMAQEAKDFKSFVNEASTVKDEAISRLSDFFRVSPNALKKFNFDGKDNIKELTKALNSTSDQGTEMYYKIAIDLAKKDLGESVSEGQELIFDINSKK